MIEPSGVNIEVGKGLVEPIIRAKINAAIVEAIGDPQAFLRQAVHVALKQKVQSDGTPCKYSSDRGFDLVEVLAKKAIREAVTDAMKEWVEEQRAALTEVVKKEIAKRPSALAKALVQGMAQTFSNTYRMHVSVEAKT